ncbi:MAG: T9SS C-terminal target domain-containing protein, partial [Calditrichaeota bacterium]
PTKVQVYFTDNNFIDAIPIGGIPEYPVDATRNWWGNYTEQDVVNWHLDAPGYGSVQVLPVRKEPVPVGYITGVLTDASDHPLVGAQVSLQGTSIATKTAVDGTFFLAAATGEYILEVSKPPGSTVLATAAVVVQPADLSTCQTHGGVLTCSPTISGVVLDPPALARIPYLHQNYPNPFNPTTTIRFFLPKREHVRLRILDVLGREVVTLLDKTLDAGPHALSFQAKHLASGLYLYQLETGRFSEIKKMVLIK